jgi:hypothetical protein
MPKSVRGVAPRVTRGAVASATVVRRARDFRSDLELRRGLEPIGADRVVRRRAEAVRDPHGRNAHSAPLAAKRNRALRSAFKRHLFPISAALVFVGAAGWCYLTYSEIRSSVLRAAAPPAAHSFGRVNSSIEKSGPITAPSTMSVERQRTASAGSAVTAPRRPTAVAAAEPGETAASIVAREWSLFQPNPLREADQRRVPAKEAKAKEAIRVASLDDDVPFAALHPAPDTAVRVPSDFEAKTSLVDFETAPFPYHGTMPGSERPFLNAGEGGHRGHVNFRGRVLWEAQTFSDDRVLLHIPPGFDPTRPAVMVVYFHGHGASLSRDVRDRQRLPQQITAAGANAVLVAPQFAVEAADSSAGKFWEPNGFKRFLDEAALKLAKLYGDPHSADAFANMPIVIVAYSGGFGPTLSVLDRGGVPRSRVRGLVLLDALYAGIDKFGDWIAHNRSAFFVSSYTPHTAHHNADLEHLLDQRSVAYGSELRRNHLQGMVTFLPAGPISHRDFVTHAWADNPVKDILARMDDVDSTLATKAAIRATAFATPAHN